MMSEAENGNIGAPPEGDYVVSHNGLAKRTTVHERLSVTHQTGGLKRLAVDCGDLTLWELFLTSEQAGHLSRLLAAGDQEAAQ
jgi:hypothetical protein